MTLDPEANRTADTFPHTWTATILAAPPLIAPVRQFVYPLYVPGEEDAMARGALLLDIKPAGQPNFLATCALGFRDPAVPTGIFPCPRPDDLLAIAGGYAYLIDTLDPARCVHLPLRPATQIFSVPSAGLILLSGFHHIIAVDAHGLHWQTDRLSWEGLTMTEVRDGHLHGTGWNLRSNLDVPFTIDLATGEHQGGGFTP